MNGRAEIDEFIEDWIREVENRNDTRKNVKEYVNDIFEGKIWEK